ncbi:MAG TPA: family 16 glycoside hydrolase [Blastocatellia bacterium]
MKLRSFGILTLIIVAIGAQAGAQRPKRIAARAKGVHVDLSKEKVGGESGKFLSMVGNWVIVQDGDKKCLAVDGRQWMRGQPAGGLAQKARSIYGSRHEEFIDNVKAFAYFPYAVAKEIDDFREGEISVRFKLVSGQLDSCAGILFNLKPNGDYLTVRFNGKEDNVVLWTFNKGKRSFVKRGSENVPLAMNQWNDLKIAIQGTSLQAYLNGKLLLEYTLAEPVSGKVGVWSKTDSVSYFDDFTVTPAQR